MCNAKKQDKKAAAEVFENSYFRTKVHLQKSRDTCLMDFDKLVFYHDPIAI